MAVRRITLGSLFSGSGGFELAGCMHGIVPVFSSEIEPFPLRVEAARFPNCKQLGSVTDIDGSKVDPVDIITFGSPCQDLSVAGKQLGIHDGERSNLFFEAIRIIKEMRDATSNQFPRFAVWENVPGAFSSNKGEDFRAVLQAFAEICEGGCGVSVPMPPKGKWLHAGTVVGNGWSVAWRVYDAQFWGVPQRRKRIYLVADFRSERAGEILFKPESVSGHSKTCGKEGEGTSDDAEGGPGGSDSVISLKGNFVDRETKQNGIGWSTENMYTLDATDKHSVCYALDATSSNSMKSSNPHSGFHEETVTKTLNTNPDPTCNQGGNVIVCLNDQGGQMMDVSDRSGCLRAQEHGHQPIVAYDCEGMSHDLFSTKFLKDGKTDPLASTDYKEPPVVCYGIEPGVAQRLNTEQRISENVIPTLRANMGDNQPAVAYGVDCRNGVIEKEKTHTIQAKPNGGMSLNCTPNVLFRNDGYGNFAEGTGTLKASGGDAGGVGVHRC